MAQLVKLMFECEVLLRSVGEVFWSNKIHVALKEKEREDFLLREVLSWYGGMGSLNDLVISEYNGHVLKGKDEERLNQELDQLINLMYEEAVRLSAHER